MKVTIGDIEVNILLEPCARRTVELLCECIAELQNRYYEAKKDYASDVKSLQAEKDGLQRQYDAIGKNCKEYCGELRPVVLKFARLMERVMAANEHRGDYRDAALCDLVDGYLRNHNYFAMSRRSGDNKAKKAKNAIDLANFVMMILDVEGLLEDEVLDGLIGGGTNEESL